MAAPATSLEQMLALAPAAGGTIVRTPAATIIVLPNAASADPDEHLSLDEARSLARLRTSRPLKDAGRRGELPLYGKERSRTVKRSELLAWIERRHVPAVKGPVDSDIEQRVRRLALSRKK